MRKSRHLISRLMLLLLAPATIFAAFWLGLVPQRFSPFAPLNLSEPNSYFLNMRLAALKRDANLCQAVLAAPLVQSSAIADEPIKNGCGWKNAVRLNHAGGARLTTDKITCEMAAALTMWLEHIVQPAAERHFSKQVTNVKHMGTYACRNIAGSKFWKDFRSQHATASAIDIDSFTLSDGQAVSVLRNWKGDTPEARFLRDVHRGACRYFRVAIGPDFNAAHANHFHFDRGALKSCR
mgnify:CR=1 FL=1